MTFVIGIADASATAHATEPGGTEGLCGIALSEVLETVFPGGASQLCRACLRASAAAESTVPLRSFGRARRAGGMA